MTDAYTITRALGGRWTGTQGMACCPAHEDRSPSLSLADGKDGRLLLHCHAGCDFTDILAALRERGLVAGSGSFKPVSVPCQKIRRDAERAQLAKRSDKARRLWQDARPVKGTLAEAYLRGRGITCALPNSYDI